MELIIGSRPTLPARGPKKPDPTRLGKNGVWVPEDVGRAEGVWSASREAWRRRFVVPKAFVWEERAEQTRATRDAGIYDLILVTSQWNYEEAVGVVGRPATAPVCIAVESKGKKHTHSTIRVILSNDLPTDVPPYFCTIQGTLSSAEFRTSDS